MVSAARASCSYLSSNGNGQLTRWRKRCPPRRAWLLWSFRFQRGRRKIQCHFPQRERRSMAHLPGTLDVVVVFFTWPEAVSLCTKILFEAANVEQRPHRWPGRRHRAPREPVATAFWWVYKGVQTINSTLPVQNNLSVKNHKRVNHGNKGNRSCCCSNFKANDNNTKAMRLMRSSLRCLLVQTASFTHLQVEAPKSNRLHQRMTWLWQSHLYIRLLPTTQRHPGRQLLTAKQ